MTPIHPDEPARLSHGGSATAGALRAYARHTRPGPADGVAAWHRLRADLDAPAPRRWRAGLASGLVTAALAAFLLVRAHPSDPAPTTAASDPSQGGATGAGGMRGASGSVGTGGSPI